MQESAEQVKSIRHDMKLHLSTVKGYSSKIKAENTFNGEVKYVKGKVGAERTIATCKESGDHGRGLNNIRKSVEKYDGHVDISHDGNIFSVSVLLYV